jgi:hypothetical protein
MIQISFKNFIMVAATGLEPAHLTIKVSKTFGSTNSPTLPNQITFFHN